MCYLRGYIKTDILWPTELVYANIYHFIINANKMAKLIRDMQKILRPLNTKAAI